MLHLRPPSRGRSGAADDGVDRQRVDAVLDALERHRAFVATDAERAGGDGARRAGELIDILEEEMRRRLEAGLIADPNGLGSIVESVRDGRVDPYSAALRILENDGALAALVRERTS